MALALDVVMVAVHDFIRDRERRQVAAHGVEHQVRHRVAVGCGVALRPADRFDVFAEVLGAFLEIGEIAVRQPQLVALGVAARELDEICAERIANAAAARVQHHPDAARFVEADLDEMISAAERAHLAHPVLRARKALLELRMLFEDLLQLAAERLRRIGQRPRLLVLVAPDRDIARDLVEHALEVALVENVAGERRARGQHAAADIDAHCRRNNGPVRGDHRADGRADPGVNIRHRRHVMMDDRKLRQIDELLPRARFHVVGIDLDRDATLFDDLLYGHKVTR